MHDYLTQIAPLYKDRVDAKTLRRELMQMLVRTSQQLAPDPLPQLEQLRARQQAEQRIEFNLQPRAEQLALHQLISSMLQKVPLTQRKQLHTHIAQQLKTRFRNGSYDQLAQYMLADNPVYLARFDDRSLRDFQPDLCGSVRSVGPGGRRPMAGCRHRSVPRQPRRSSTGDQSLSVSILH